MAGELLGATYMYIHVHSVSEWKSVLGMPVSKRLLQG